MLREQGNSLRGGNLRSGCLIAVQGNDLKKTGKRSRQLAKAKYPLSAIAPLFICLEVVCKEKLKQQAGKASKTE